MSMDIEKSAKDWKKSTPEQKKHMAASGVGAIIGGYLGGYPGMMMGMSLMGYLFKPSPPKRSDTYNDDITRTRVKLDPVPDVIGTDMCPGKCIYFNKSNFGVYESSQLPDMGDSINEPAWQDFIDQMGELKIGTYAEFAINFAARYNRSINHLGITYINKLPQWFWAMFSDMFENYDDPLTPYSPITLMDGGQNYWFSEIDVDTVINMPVNDNLVFYFKGFLADFSALGTEPEQSNYIIDINNMAEMNPIDFQMSPMSTFPTFMAEVNRADVDMSGESMQGGKGMPLQSWFYDESTGVRRSLNADQYNIYSNQNGKYNKLPGFSAESTPFPLVIDPVEYKVTFPESDYTGDKDKDLIQSYLYNNVTKGTGTKLQCTDIFDDRQYICVFRNWWNPYQGLGVLGIDVVNHHHANYGAKIDLYYHDMTRDDCKITSVLYDQEYSTEEGDGFNPRYEFQSMRCDDTYIYLFGNRIQTDFFYSDMREIDSGANSVFRAYGDFSQYPTNYLSGYYAALQQEGFWKWREITSQTSTYIEVSDSWGTVPIVGKVVQIKRHPTSDCGYAICGEGSTKDLIITNPPSPSDMCSPAATKWEKCGFSGYANQVACSYSDEDDTTITLSESLPRDPIPGETIFFTEPDQDFDEDITNPLLSVDGTDEQQMLLELGFTNVNVRWSQIINNENSFSHIVCLRINKNTGAITVFDNERYKHPHTYGFYWWTGDLSCYTCQTDVQAFVYNHESQYGTTMAAYSYIIDFSSGKEEEQHERNQFADSHTPLWLYHGCVSIKEWNGSAWVDTWYTVLTCYDSYSGFNDCAGQGNHFLKLSQGKFSNKRDFYRNVPTVAYGVDIGRRGIKKILYRASVATGPLYGGIYGASYPDETTYAIGKIALHNTIYFIMYKGNHATIYPTFELWRYKPPSDTNPAGELIMMHKTKMEDSKTGDVYQWNRMVPSLGFQQVISGFHGGGTGMWYHCDESPPTIIEEFWNEYEDPRYIPHAYEYFLDPASAKSICNEYIPAKIYKPEGVYEITERRFQFSMCYEQPIKMHDVIHQILETCQGFISQCTWSTTYSDYFKIIVPNPDELPVHYFGREEAILTSNQLSDDKQLIYADLSAYPDNFWKGDEVDFGSEVRQSWPYNNQYMRYGVVIEQTSTYIKLGWDLYNYWPDATQFTLTKDNIKEGTFTFAEKSEVRRPNKVRIEFRNRMCDYIKDVAEAEDAYRLDVLGEPEKIDFYKMHGIKRASQAGRLALRILDQWNYQKYLCAFQTDIMGMTLCMGEIIALKHETTGWNYKYFRIMSMDELMDFEVKIELEEFNPYCYHDAGVPVMNGYFHSGFPSPYQPNHVENFTVHEDIEHNRLYFTFNPPENDAGYFVGARIYYWDGSNWQYFAIVTETVSSVQLAQDVSETDTTIYYDNDYLTGTFPSEGILWLEDEMIYYHGIDTTNYAFTNCIRGYKETIIAEHIISDDSELVIKLRNDATQYMEIPSGWEGTTKSFRAAAFVIQQLTADLANAPEASIDIVGYGLLPYFPESIHQPISQLPETQYLFEALGMSGTLDEIERITESLGLGDDLDYIDIVQVIESLGLGDDNTIAEMLIALTESLGLGDDVQALATEYITESLGLGDTDTIAEMLIAISESLGLGDDLDYITAETFDFETDFSEYTTSSPPGDWTEHFHTTTFQMDIVTSPADTGGKSLEFDMTTLSQRAAVSWDDIGLQYNSEILCKVRWPTAGSYLIGPASRISGGDTDENCYAVFSNDTGDQIILYRFKNGSSGSLDTYSITLAIDTWYWIRMKVEEDNIKVRIWADGGSEPGSWHIDFTESGTNQIFSMGKVGLFNFDQDGYCDEFKANLIDEQFDYITDFEEYTLSSPPGDWTEQWNTGNFSLDISTSGSLSKNVLFFNMTSASMMATTWDDIPDCEDVDILTCVTTIADGANNIGPVARLSGSSSSETGYLVWTNFTSGQITLSRYNAGSGATLDTYSITLTGGTWYWIRMRVVGANIKVKVWSGTRSDEPGSWHIDYDDSSPVLSSGKVGLAAYSQDGYTHVFAANVLDGAEGQMMALQNNLL